MAVASAGIGMVGLISIVFTSVLPFTLARKIQISTILSVPTLTPVVSKSNIAKGRLRFNSMLLFFVY